MARHPVFTDVGTSFSIKGSKRIPCALCTLRLASKKVVVVDRTTGERFEVDACSECARGKKK